MNKAQLFFFSEAIRHARTLAYPDMMEFLRGMSFSVEESPESEAFLTVYRHLNQCDEQLELIVAGQLKFSLAQSAEKGSHS